MGYYEIYVAEVRHQKPEPLTYASDEKLEIGSLVSVPYGTRKASGFVCRKVPKPDFEAKPILSVPASGNLPAAALKLHEWMLTYYPGGSGAATQLFVPSGLDVKPRAKKQRAKHKITDDLPPLTLEQAQVLREIEKSDKQTFLLHGETGSGKTRVYFELAKKSLAAGKSALILTPEISLVPQLQHEFEKYFDDQVVVIHSGLPKARRTKNWLRILHSSEPLIIIGTRSALFAPIDNIGLIAVDEMHEPAYKQDSSPKYQALRAAAQLAHIHDSRLIYGSATPSVVEYYLAEATKTPILRMRATAITAQEVTRSVVDLKDSKLFSKNRYLSDQLIASIGQKLSLHEQVLLFLNRRGTARQILCQSCGWQAMCPRCDTPFTYHGDVHRMRCHTCGYHATPPLACPVCKSEEIVYRSIGTKALVDSLSNLFPQATIRRFDTDNLADEQLSRHFESVKKGEVDILVGTQMLGKGLDLPKLSLVGIVNADTSLSMPDFSSSERSYQLLHQAIGRVGRGHVQGEVIVQTFNPDSFLLQAALNQNWKSFYDHELKEREQFSFPPFSYLLKFTVSRKNSGTAENYIRGIRAKAAKLNLKIEINEPTPSFYERSHGMYNWQMIIRAKRRTLLTELLKNLPAGDYVYDLDPANLL